MSHHVDPTREQFEAFKALPRDTPINMVNLVQFRDLANYPGDHVLARDGLTGAQAYAQYGNHTAPILKKVGGAVIWRGSFDATLIGAQDEAWDAMFIVRYPGANAFLAMVTDPEYQKHVVHRQAAVLTSRLIRATPSDAQDRFA
ncbi:DUF1330 domain-containing protein [Sulfitobacter albidus]|uniref:DUF1330 domain-containing protein n=1 Tax=Sulfitobacter albidus TaxID=2829501 RepID=A0A975PL86_9RHOB|nr:DUF1330 domain-containing protein [Sulfitobacter albidus]QUJ75453.1 DUF1330 domain-containing protein [Sulfitobacter albidus]